MVVWQDNSAGLAPGASASLAGARVRTGWGEFGPTTSEFISLIRDAIEAAVPARAAAAKAAVDADMAPATHGTPSG